jgi:hypothetical protein
MARTDSAASVAETKCKEHCKPVEAYCFEDEELLCVDCMKRDYRHKDRGNLAQISLAIQDELQASSDSLKETLTKVIDNKFID